MINSIFAIIRERVNPILQFLQVVICKLNLWLWHNNIVVSFNVSQWTIIINSMCLPICGNIVISVKLFSTPNSIPCLCSVCSEISRHVAILLQFIPVSRSCSIISFVIMYAGLPLVLAKNANGGFSFGRILNAFKTSDVFLNNIAKDTSNTSNRSPREEFCDCDVTISILVRSSSFLEQISNPTWSDAR